MNTRENAAKTEHGRWFVVLATLFIKPYLELALIPATLVNRGPLTREQLRPIFELAPALFLFCLLGGGAMIVCLALIFLIAFTFGA